MLFFNRPPSQLSLWVKPKFGISTHVLLVSVFWQWPPPKSIYLKTLTYSNYVGPLLWYAIFLSSPAIFDSWADPPPLAHSCLLACCSWHHIQKSCSLSAVPSKEEGHQKAFFSFFFSRRVLSTRVSLNPPCLSVCKWSGGGGGGGGTPLALCV